MRPRVILGQFLIRFGRFIQSLAIMAMKPDDLQEFSRQFYARPEVLDSWSQKDFVGQGLNPLELALLNQVPAKPGRLLLLGVGGGREAIALARLGLEVTGVDFVPGMVLRAQENAARHGVKIAGLVQELSHLQVPEGSFDLAWLTSSMYSGIPTRRQRVRMLRRIHKALAPGGFFICTFHWETEARFSPPVELARKTFACLTRGNLSYEPGDLLWLNKEFIHAFSSEAELLAEFAEGNFRVVRLQLPKSDVEGGAVLAK